MSAIDEINRLALQDGDDLPMDDQPMQEIPVEEVAQSLNSLDGGFRGGANVTANILNIDNQNDKNSFDALTKMCTTYRTVCEQLMQGTKSEQMVQVLRQLAPQNERFLFSRFVYWEMFEKDLSKQLAETPQVKSQVQSALNKISGQMRQSAKLIVNTARIPSMFKPFIVDFNIQFELYVKHFKGKRYHTDENVKDDVKNLVSQLLDDIDPRQTEKVAKDLIQFDVDYFNPTFLAVEKKGKNSEQYRAFQLFMKLRENSLKLLLEHIGKYEKAVKTFLEKYNSYTASEIEYGKLIRIFNGLSNYGNTPNFIEKAIDGFTVDQIKMINAGTPAIGAAISQAPNDICKGIDFAAATATQAYVKNVYAKLYRNIFEIIKNYKFIMIFTDEINKHSKLDIDYNQLVIHVIMHYMVLVAFVPNSTGDGKVHLRHNTDIDNPAGNPVKAWHEMKFNTMGLESIGGSFYLMLSRLATGVVQSIYGSFLLIIDRYRQKGKTLMKLIGQGKKSGDEGATGAARPIDAAFVAYKLFRQVHGLFVATVAQLSTKGARGGEYNMEDAAESKLVRLKVSLPAGSKFFAMYMALTTETSNVELYIKVFNELWNTYSAPTAGEISQRCKAMIKEYIDDLMKALVQYVFGDDIVRAAQPIAQHSYLKPETLNDLDDDVVDTNASFPGTEMDPIKLKTDAIELYLRVTDQINTFITADLGDANSYDEGLREQYAAYYAKETTLYQQQKPEQKLSYLNMWIMNNDAGVFISDKCESVARSVGVPLNQYLRFVEDVIKMLVLYYRTHVEIVDDKDKRAEVLVALKYVLRQQVKASGSTMYNEAAIKDDVIVFNGNDLVKVTAHTDNGTHANLVKVAQALIVNGRLYGSGVGPVSLAQLLAVGDLKEADQDAALQKVLQEFIRKTVNVFWVGLGMAELPVDEDLSATNANQFEVLATNITNVHVNLFNVCQTIEQICQFVMTFKESKWLFGGNYRADIIAANNTNFAIGAFHAKNASDVGLGHLAVTLALKYLITVCGFNADACVGAGTQGTERTAKLNAAFAHEPHTVSFFKLWKWGSKNAHAWAIYNLFLFLENSETNVANQYKYDTIGAVATLDDFHSLSPLQQIVVQDQGLQKVFIHHLLLRIMEEEKETVPAAGGIPEEEKKYDIEPPFGPEGPLEQAEALRAATTEDLSKPTKDVMALVAKQEDEDGVTMGPVAAQAIQNFATLGENWQKDDLDAVARRRVQMVSGETAIKTELDAIGTYVTRLVREAPGIMNRNEIEVLDGVLMNKIAPVTFNAGKNTISDNAHQQEAVLATDPAGGGAGNILIIKDVWPLIKRHSQQYKLARTLFMLQGRNAVGDFRYELGQAPNLVAKMVAFRTKCRSIEGLDADGVVAGGAANAYRWDDPARARRGVVPLPANFIQSRRWLTNVGAFQDIPNDQLPQLTGAGLALNGGAQVNLLGANPTNAKFFEPVAAFKAAMATGRAGPAAVYMKCILNKSPNWGAQQAVKTPILDYMLTGGAGDAAGRWAATLRNNVATGGALLEAFRAAVDDLQGAEQTITAATANNTGGLDPGRIGALLDAAHAIQSAAAHVLLGQCLSMGADSYNAATGVCIPVLQAARDALSSAVAVDRTVGNNFPAWLAALVVEHHGGGHNLIAPGAGGTGADDDLLALEFVNATRQAHGARADLNNANTWAVVAAFVNAVIAQAGGGGTRVSIGDIDVTKLFTHPTDNTEGIAVAIIDQFVPFKAATDAVDVMLAENAAALKALEIEHSCGKVWYESYLRKEIHEVATGAGFSEVLAMIRLVAGDAGQLAEIGGNITNFIDGGAPNIMTGGRNNVMMALGYGQFIKKFIEQFQKMAARHVQGSTFYGKGRLAPGLSGAGRTGLRAGMRMAYRGGANIAEFVTGPTTLLQYVLQNNIVERYDASHEYSPGNLPFVYPRRELAANGNVLALANGALTWVLTPGEFEFLQQNPPYLVEAHYGNTYTKFSSAIDMLTKIPGVVFSNGGIDFGELLRNIEKQRANIMNAMKPYADKNTYGQYDWLIGKPGQLGQLQVLLNYSPVIDTIIKQYVKTPLPFERIIDYWARNPVSRTLSGNFDSGKIKYQLSDLTGNIQELPQDQYYMAYTYTDIIKDVEISKQGRMKLCPPYNVRHISQQAMLDKPTLAITVGGKITNPNDRLPFINVVEELSHILDYTIERLKNNRNVIPQSFVDALQQNDYVMRAMQLSEVKFKNTLLNLPLNAIQTPFKCPIIHGMKNQSMAKSYINQLTARNAFVSHIGDDMDIVTDTMRQYMVYTQPNKQNYSQLSSETRQSYMKFFKAVAASDRGSGLSNDHIPNEFVPDRVAPYLGNNGRSVADQKTDIAALLNYVESFNADATNVSLAQFFGASLWYVNENIFKLAGLREFLTKAGVDHPSDITGAFDWTTDAGGTVAARVAAFIVDAGVAGRLFFNAVMGNYINLMQRITYNFYVHSKCTADVQFQPTPELGAQNFGWAARAGAAVAANPVAAIADLKPAQQRKWALAVSRLTSLHMLHEMGKTDLGKADGDAGRMAAVDRLLVAEIKTVPIYAIYGTGVDAAENADKTNATGTQHALGYDYEGVVQAEGAGKTIHGSLAALLKPFLKAGTNTTNPQSYCFVQNTFNTQLQLNPMAADSYAVDAFLWGNEKDRAEWSKAGGRWQMNAAHANIVVPSGFQTKALNLFKTIVKIPLECQLGMFEGLRRPERLQPLIACSGEYIYDYQTNNRINEYTELEVLYQPVTNSQQLQLWYDASQKKIEELITGAGTDEAPFISNGIRHDNVMPLNIYDILLGTVDIKWGTTSTGGKPLYSNIMNTVAQYMLRLALEPKVAGAADPKDTNELNQIELQLAQFDEIEGQIDAKAAKSPQDFINKKAVANQRNILLQRKARLESNVTTYRVNDDVAQMLFSAAANSHIQMVFAMPATTLDLYNVNKQSPLGFAKNQIIQESYKDELLRMVNEQTIDLIYNKQSRQVEEFSPQMMYEEPNKDACLFMHTVFGLQNADEVEYTDLEKFEMLKYLPLVKKHLTVLQYKIQGMGYGAVSGVVATLQTAVQKLINEAKEIIPRLPEDFTDIYEKKYWDETNFIDFSDENVAKLENRALKMVYKMHVEKSTGMAGNIGQLADTWYRIRELEQEFAALAGVAGVKVKFRDTKLLQWFMRLAFMRKRTPLRQILGCMNWWVARPYAVDGTAIRANDDDFLIRYQQPTYDTNKLSRTPSWYDDEAAVGSNGIGIRPVATLPPIGYGKHKKEFLQTFALSEVGQQSVRAVVRNKLYSYSDGANDGTGTANFKPLTSLTLLSVADQQTAINVAKQFYMFIDQTNKIVTAQTLMWEAYTYAGITPTAEVNLYNNLGFLKYWVGDSYTANAAHWWGADNLKRDEPRLPYQKMLVIYKTKADPAAANLGGGYDKDKRAQWITDAAATPAALNRYATSPVQFMYQLLFNKYDQVANTMVSGVAGTNAQHIHLFRIIGIDPFHPINLIKKNMAFPILTTMNIYIDKYKAKLGISNLYAGTDAARSANAFYEVANTNATSTVVIGQYRNKPVQLATGVDGSVITDQNPGGAVADNGAVALDATNQLFAVVKQHEGQFWLYQKKGSKPTDGDIGLLNQGQTPTDQLRTALQIDPNVLPTQQRVVKFDANTGVVSQLVSSDFKNFIAASAAAHPAVSEAAIKLLYVQLTMTTQTAGLTAGSATTLAFINTIGSDNNGTAFAAAANVTNLKAALTLGQFTAALEAIFEARKGAALGAARVWLTTTASLVELSAIRALITDATIAAPQNVNGQNHTQGLTDAINAVILLRAFMATMVKSEQAPLGSGDNTGIISMLFTTIPRMCHAFMDILNDQQFSNYKTLEYKNHSVTVPEKTKQEQASEALAFDEKEYTYK